MELLKQKNMSTSFQLINKRYMINYDKIEYINILMNYTSIESSFEAL